MKKFFLLLLASFLFVPAAKSELSADEVNLYNIKEKNAYLLSLSSRVYEFNIVNEDILNIVPMSSITDDKKMLVVEAKKSGVSDISIRTEDALYQVRFVIGPEFQKESEDLIMIDLPFVLVGGE